MLIMNVGRVGHQKRIRKYIRLISYSSPAHNAVWSECYSRWKAISAPIFEQTGPFNMHQDTLFQWQNLTLFLATLCGAGSRDKAETTTLMKTIPLEFIPDNMRASINVPELADSFIGDLVALLVHESAVVRDTTREALGSELSPKFYVKLVQVMDRCVFEIALDGLF